MGGIRSSRVPTPRDLSAAQVRRLQAALNILGCNAGPPDGELGQRTQQAVSCGLRKKNLGSNDYAGLYRSLNLNF
jgi:peptidoglycan hydrolase-like protein with peptidoglycan-binding domain